MAEATQTTFEIRYLVPVYVIVDIEDESVTRVVVADEEIRHDRLYARTPGNDDERRAEEIAETADWPEWEFGF